MPASSGSFVQQAAARVEPYLRQAGFSDAAQLAQGAAQGNVDQGKLEQVLQQHRKELPVAPDPKMMADVVRLFFGNSGDVAFRWIDVGPTCTRALLISLNGLADAEALQRIMPALLNDLEACPAPQEPEELVDWIMHARLALPAIKAEARLDSIISALLDGDAVLFLTGAKRTVRLQVPGWKQRAITEPETEGVVRGPREGFTESFATNMSLLRRRVRNERFQLDTFDIGRLTGTRVGLVYVRGVCKQSLVTEAKRRLQRIKIDSILDSAYIEELVEDTPWTVFPQLKATERPDVVASALLEGRFAILVDGSPFALTAPALLVDMMQAPDDYYERYPVVTLLRVLRWSFMVVALLGPGLYVALTTFHQEMIPSTLLITIMASREGVPFPAVVEAMLMEVTFEALREAGVRLPKTVGQTVSIVGALVIGDAAVNAGIVSAPMVIVVAITGIASFMIPKYSTAIAIRMLRFPMLFLAGAFGAFGITLGMLVILIHLLGLRSFGVPYLAPIGPWMPDDQKDVVVRVPRWAMRARPAAVETPARTRARPGMRPGPEQGKGKGKKP